MCISIIQELPNNIPKYGWKVFRKQEGNLYSELESTSIIRPINKWIKKEEHTKIIVGGTLSSEFNHKTPEMNETEYTSGFHMFETKKEAKVWRGRGYNTIRKVEMKDVHTYGSQHAVLALTFWQQKFQKQLVTLKVFVCNEIKIITPFQDFCNKLIN